MLSGSRNESPDPYPASTTPPWRSQGVEVSLPGLELAATVALERQVVETNAALAERAIVIEGGNCAVHERRTADEPHHVAKRTGVLIEYWLGAEDRSYHGTLVSRSLTVSATW